MRNLAIPRGSLLWFAFSAFLLTAPAPTAHALSLGEAIARSFLVNERGLAAQETAEAAAARVNKARSFLLPDVNLSGVYTRRSEAAGPSTLGDRDGVEAVAVVDQILLDAQAWPLLTQAKRARDAAQEDAREEKRSLAFDTAETFLGVLARERVTRAAEERSALALRNLEEVRVRFDAQLVGSNDVTRAELELATAEREAVEARGLARIARLSLGYILDAEVQDSLEVPVGLLEQAVIPVAPDSLLPAQAISRRPDILAGRARVAALRAAAREPLMRYVPDLRLTGTASAVEERGEDSFEDEWRWGVGLFWSLFDGGERHADRSERSALLRASEYQLAYLERGVAVEIETARVALESEQASLTRADVAVIAARRNANEAAELYRQGLVRAFEVVDAGVQLFEADVERTATQFSLVVAYLEWRRAMGWDPLEPEEMP